MTNIHRKVFDELAEMFKSNWYSDTEGPWSTMVLETADVLKANCSTFDKQRFLKACGIRIDDKTTRWPELVATKEKANETG